MTVVVGEKQLDVFVTRASVDSEFVLFMNSDIEVVLEKWLEQLVAVTQLYESIVVVGGLLLYPNGMVQHGDIILGLYDTAGHVHRHIYGSVPGYNLKLALNKERFCRFRPFPVEEQIPELANLPEDYRDGIDSI